MIALLLLLQLCLGPVPSSGGLSIFQSCLRMAVSTSCRSLGIGSTLSNLHMAVVALSLEVRHVSILLGNCLPLSCRLPQPALAGKNCVFLSLMDTPGRCCRISTMQIKQNSRMFVMGAKRMMLSTITAYPGLGSVSKGLCQTSSKGLLLLFRSGCFTWSVVSSLVLAHMRFISSVAASIFSFSHSHSASFPFLSCSLLRTAHPTLFPNFDATVTKAACAFVAPTGIELKSFFPLVMKSAAFSLEAGVIFTCQCPASPGLP